ncbi:MAG TPA: hypothetical protein VD788_02590 [Candidatus Polarisedimenticolaceae bacterium]|nr:hypothetical protein [Candidatus Polarisedimenticolaceae bacterium]
MSSCCDNCSRLLSLAVAAIGSHSIAAGDHGPARELAPYVRIDAPRVALRQVALLDGTGAGRRERQTVLIDRGRLQAVGPSLASISAAA